jgi:tetratricopeptide (TPR) repeat protein
MIEDRLDVRALARDSIAPISVRPSARPRESIVPTTTRPSAPAPSFAPPPRLPDLRDADEEATVRSRPSAPPLPGLGDRRTPSIVPSPASPPVEPTLIERAEATANPFASLFEWETKDPAVESGSGDDDFASALDRLRTTSTSTDEDEDATADGGPLGGQSGRERDGEAVRPSSLTEADFNPFARLSESPEDRPEPPSLKGFLEDSGPVPSGLQAMFGNAVDALDRTTPVSRVGTPPPARIRSTSRSSFETNDEDAPDSLLGGVDRAASPSVAKASTPGTADGERTLFDDEEEPRATRDDKALLDDDAPPVAQRPSFLPTSTGTDSNSLNPFDDDFVPPSIVIDPTDPSLTALDNALGNILGHKFSSMPPAGAERVSSQLEEILRDAERTTVLGPDVDFGELVDDFDDDNEAAPSASNVPPAAETLRGAIHSDDPFEGPKTRAALRSAGRGWDGIPGQVDLAKIRSGANDDILDVDGSDVHSVPPPAPQRWPEEVDDFAEPVRRRGSSAAARSSAPPPPKSDPPEDEATVDSVEIQVPSASEWGSVPPPALSERKAIPNYDDTIENLARSVPIRPEPRKGEARPPSLPSTSLPPLAGRPKPLVPNLGVWLAGLVVLGAVAVTLLPWYLLQRAEKYSNNCFRDVLRTAEGDPHGCVPSTSELALARSLPWLEEDARRIKESSEFRAARLAYDKATAIVPNATRRDEAARKLLELTYRGSSSERTAALGVVAGAHTAVTQFALANREPEAVSFALRSARAVGQIDDMRALATGSSEEDPFGMSLRRGALLCLLGDANEGARAFVAADVSHQRLNTSLDGHGLARLGLVACGKPKGVNGEIDAHAIGDRIRPAMAALEASLETQEGFAAARAFLEDPKFKVGGIQRLRIAPWVVRETQPSALEALRLLAPQHAAAARLDLNAVRSPWTLLDVEAPVQAVYVEPAVAETAANYLTTLAAKVDGKRLDCSGEECPDPAALKLPEAILNEAARMFWFESAAEHARLGHREATLEAVQRASDLAVKARRHLGAPLLLAVGDAEGALGLLADALENLEAYTPQAQTRIHTNQALALAHLGRFDKAQAAAEKAFLAAGEAEEAARSASEGLDADVALQDDRVSSAWLWAATSLLVGKPGAVSESLRDAQTKELSEVATWVGLATRPEEERRVERWELALLTPSQSALPAVMYVVSRAVPSMTDVEVWLDRLFQQEHRTQPTRAMLARSEAARWRNDPEAERTWQTRASKVLGLVKDYRTALLAHVLELR